MRRIASKRAAGAAPLLLTLTALACEAGAGGDVGQAGGILLSGDSASNPTVAWSGAAGHGYAAWVGREEGQNAVFVAAVAPGGEISNPVRANDIPGDAAPHLQAPAQVAVGREGTVYVLWQNNTPVVGRRFPASDLRLAVSTDGGRSFAPAVTVNDDAGGVPSSHTFHDLAVAADGTVYVSWIDSRERDAAAHQRMMSSGEHAHHAPLSSGPGAGPVGASHDHAGVGAAEGPEIRVARSTDGGRTFEPSVVVDSAACPCCRTSLALGADGSVYVAWRKIYPGDVRDIVVARAGAGELRFAEPVRVHRDEWVFPGCPHAGPSLAMDGDGRLLVGWYTGREGRQGLWYAVSGDEGRSFGAPSAVLTAEWVPPSQLRLATRGERVWAVWDDRTGARPLIRAATGRIGAPLEPLDDWTAPGGDPSIATSPEGAAVAWLDASTAKLALLRE